MSSGGYKGEAGVCMGTRGKGDMTERYSGEITEIIYGRVGGDN